MRQLRLIIAGLMLLGIGSFQAQAQDPSGSSEYLIKAGFIYNFAKLVEWPTTAFAQTDSPIVIGIFGVDPFGATLDRVLDGKKINGRGFVVRRLKSVSDVKDCHVVFVSSSETAHYEKAIQSVKGMPVLTIGEGPGFAQRGGVINLTLEDNKVRFEVNVGAARQADLTISSRLLALAKIIQPESDGRKAE